jgi:hypothetical protein
VTTQPQLDLPYRDEDERAGDLFRLIELDRRLHEWLDLASRPPYEWPADALDTVIHAPPYLAGDSPEAKLRRWASLFNEEIQIVREVRNRLVHNLRVTDGELRGAVWIAHHLLALLGPKEHG